MKNPCFPWTSAGKWKSLPLVKAIRDCLKFVEDLSVFTSANLHLCYHFFFFFFSFFTQSKRHCCEDSMILLRTFSRKPGNRVCPLISWIGCEPRGRSEMKSLLSPPPPPGFLFVALHAFCLEVIFLVYFLSSSLHVIIGVVNLYVLGRKSKAILDWKKIRVFSISSSLPPFRPSLCKAGSMWPVNKKKLRFGALCRHPPLGIL